MISKVNSLLVALVVCFSASAFAQRVLSPTATNNYVVAPGHGRLAELYQQLLSGSCTQGFVAFERVILSPKSGPRPPAPAAVAFCWAGAHYLITVSRGVAVTNTEALASGDKLYGFDGEAYWCWQGNPPVRVFAKTDGHRGSGPPLDSYTTLHVISKAEVLKGQGQYPPDVGFSTSTGLAAECREVVQFGFPYRLKGPPRLAGSDVTFESAEDGATVRAHLDGDPHRPAGLSYSLPTGRAHLDTAAKAKPARAARQVIPLITSRLLPTGVKTRFSMAAVSGCAPTGKGFRLLLDYAADTVDIARLSGTNVTADIRYHLLAARTDGRAQAPSSFSWPAHVPETGRVMTEVVTNGATFLASITTNKELLLEKMLVPAKPLTEKPNYKR